MRKLKISKRVKKKKVNHMTKFKREIKKAKIRIRDQFHLRKSQKKQKKKNQP